MPERRLDIARLVLRIRGVAPGEARSLAAALGERVVHGLADRLAQQAPTPAQLERVDAGVVRIAARRTPAQSADGAAAIVVEAIQRRVDGERG